MFFLAGVGVKMILLCESKARSPHNFLPAHHWPSVRRSFRVYGTGPSDTKLFSCLLLAYVVGLIYLMICYRE